eukprot:Awhi_evm1s15202
MLSENYKKGDIDFGTIFTTECSENMILNAVYSNAKNFNLISNTLKTIHISCAGPSDFLEDVATVKDCADKTAGQPYNAFTFDPVRRMCSLKTCEKGFYETKDSNPGWLSYV